MSMTTPTQETLSQAHSETEHQHVELVRLLEENGYIFAQNPAIISRAVKLEPASAYDKLFIRAKRIDSNGALQTALENAQFSIMASKKALYVIYFILGFIGVLGLLSTGVLNFFYLLVALLGWHTFSLLLWLITRFSHRQGMLMALIDRVTLKSPLIQRLLSAKNTPFNTALSMISQQLKPIKDWYLSAIMHGAWLMGLFGTLSALLSLFLFKHYEFTWESTLLSDAHFIQMMKIIGYLPHLIGVPMPNYQAPRTDAAAFAWLVIAAIILYGVLPRLIAWAVSAYKAKHQFSIDVSLSYYARLLSYYKEVVIDKDDYQPAKAVSQAVLLNPTQPLILAMLERQVTTDKLALSAAHEFGVVDSRDEIDSLLNQAKTTNAIIYLAISTQTPPDRGLLRKVDALMSGMAAHGGIIAELIDSTASGMAQSTHREAWAAALTERAIPLAS